MNRDGTKLESERILTVIDELLEDLGTLAYVPSYYGEIPDEDLAFITTSASSHPQSQQILEGHYDVERKLDEDVRTAGVDTETERQHAHSIRAVIDTLRAARYGDSENADGYKPSAPPNDAILRFQKIIRTLRGLVHNNFETTVEEDDQKLQILRDTVSREQHASADVKALNREFMTERKLRTTEVMKKDQAIRKLMEEHDDVESKATEDIQQYKRAADERQLMEVQKAEQEEKELEDHLAKLKAQLEELKRANHKDELSLRGERKKKENQVFTIISDYDKEMKMKFQQKKDLKQEIERDQKELTEVSKEVEKYQEENTTAEEEESTKGQRDQHRAFMKLHIDDGCKTIQAFWRGFMERKKGQQRAKKGKGGGGGGKKSGKK